jgi:hypothetical protein
MYLHIGDDDELGRGDFKRRHLLVAQKFLVHAAEHGHPHLIQQRSQAIAQFHGLRFENFAHGSGV